MTNYFLGSEQKKRDNKGSPKSGEPVFLVIGKIRKPHGIRGELVFEVTSDFAEHIKPGIHVFLGASKESYFIQSIRKKGNNLLITIEGLRDRNSVEGFRNIYVFVKASSLPPLHAGEYYNHDLLGTSVYTTEGKKIGRIVEILKTGANDVYVIASGKRDKQEILIPAIDSVVLKIDIATKKMIVDLQEWD